MIVHGMQEYLSERIIECALVALTEKTKDHLHATIEIFSDAPWLIRLWGRKGCLCQLEFRLDQTTIFLKLWHGYISIACPEKTDKPVEEFTGDISDLQQLEKDLTHKLKEFPWPAQSKAS
jgi:hypothetical protein